MHLPASLKSCRTRPSPAIRSSLCRSTPRPRTNCRGFVCSAFHRDRSKKNSKRCSSKANEETQQNCDQTARKKWCRPTSDATGDGRGGDEDLSSPPGRRKRSPAPGSHRTWRADFPHHALRQLVHSFHCYLFKFRFHGQLIFSLSRRP